MKKPKIVFTVIEASTNTVATFTEIKPAQAFCDKLNAASGAWTARLFENEVFEAKKPSRVKKVAACLVDRYRAAIFVAKTIGLQKWKKAPAK